MKFQYHPDDAIALPVSIRPTQTKGIWRDLVPGVRLLPYAGQLRDLIEGDKNKPPQAHYVVHPSHILLIHPSRYLVGVRKRVHAEGSIVPKPKYEIVSPLTVTRQCLVATILASRSRCAVASYYGLIRRGRKWHINMWSYNHLQETSPLVYTVRPPEQLDLVSAKQVALKIDHYYRDISWWRDRVGMALGYLWEGLCAPYPAQTYISFITLVDSLVGTFHSSGHALAERVAMMLGTDLVTRRAIYDEMVRLYKIRNHLVHANMRLCMGKKTALSVFMGAKHSNVPSDDMSRLFSLCVRLINCSLKDKGYLSIIQTKGSEDTVNKQLDNLFLDRLLGAS